MPEEVEVNRQGTRYRFLDPAPALQHHLSMIAMELAVLRFWRACIKANFNPAQPRAPAGSPDGGQWTDGEGAVDRPVRLAEDRKRRYSVFLQDHEGRLGSHTITRHVAKTDAEMMARMETGRWHTLFARGTPLRNGSFALLKTANDFVNRVLDSNRTIVDEVATGRRDGKFLNKRFGFATGREAFRPLESAAPYMRVTYEVGVQIYHDPGMPNGFLVYTAYPRNSLPKEHQ